MEPITNRVAESDLEVYNLETLWDGAEVVELDLEPFLYEGLILKEKLFRERVQAHDWAQYAEKHVAVHCSTDAIIPTWAFMLVVSKLHGAARSAAFGRRDDLVRDYFTRRLEAEDWSRYAGSPVVIKGCASRVVPTSAYLHAVEKLQDVARKLMYGEACSSVPLWRKPQKAPRRSARPAGVKKPDLPTPGRSG